MERDERLRSLMDSLCFGIVLCGEDGSTAPMRECTALLDSLPEGTIYFVMTTYNTEGVESDPSGEASKVVDCP